MLVSVLGPVSLSSADDTELDVRGTRQAALLAALAARAGQVVTVDRLVDLLWGDAPPANPSGALHSAVFKLRARLSAAAPGRGVLVGRERGYLLDLGPDDLDADTFERLVEEARSLPPAEAGATLAAALDLWRGRAFEPFGDTEIAHLEALRLDELRMAATEALAAALLDADRAGDAVAVMQPFVTEHPLRERARIVLMRALHAQGRTSDALGQYHQHRRFLADELGLEPSEDMRRVQADLLRAPDPLPVAPRQPPAGLTGLKVRYLRTTAGHRIAHGTTGNGPRVVVILGWVSSLDVIVSGRDPRSSLLQRLVGGLSLTLYDRLGTGLSTGEVTDYGLRASVDELAAVIEATGGPPVSLMAMSAAGPIALTLAYERPDWVDSLVLFGTFSNGPGTFRDERLRSMIVEIVRTHWGMGSKLLADLYRPGLSDEAAWHLAKMFRDSAASEVAAEYLSAMYPQDVADLLPAIKAPALVLHYRSDRLISFTGAQDLMAGLPNATLVPLDGRFHLPDSADVDLIEQTIVAHVRRHASGEIM